ncbi:MAG: 16S rRNA (guanine(527)-N(7))-methyltransferase RsmG [Victivallaceae bacterium]
MTNLTHDLECFFKRCRVPNLANFIAKCEQLYSLLNIANQQVNLTRIDSEAGFWLKHVADSLAISIYFPELSSEKLSLGDIGCGAGFPSLILAAAFPNLHITAIDSIGKKTAFVEAAAKELNLHNLNIFTGRTKEMNRLAQWQSRFDIVTARAVADARTLYREARNFPKPDGKFIFYKTPEQTATDFPQVAAASAQHNITWLTTEVFELPCNSGQRQFLYSSN